MAAAERRLRVLFLCTGNSCRSQMAEGWARALRGSRVEAYSAGTQPQGLNPLAVRAMAEAGVDISGQRSKSLHEFTDAPLDVVVTVCDAASQSCPLPPANARVVHVGFDDPPALARGAASQEEAMGHYRRVRDEIRRFIETLPESLTGDPPMPETPCCQSGCCSPDDDSRSGTAGAAASTGAAPVAMDVDAVRERVREGYSTIARGGCCGPGGSGGGCCGATAFSAQDLARAIGYSGDELAALPDGANLGLSCGNPLVLASLRPGDVVLDLGSGGGFDCFVAGPRVGPSGRVIGVDMTPDMLSRARANLGVYRSRTGLDNVEFRLGEIESLPVADASVDVVISNCVLNLSPDKPRVWREIARVLKPGGRVAVSDLALLRPLPASVRADVEALIGCVAGAVMAEETRGMAQAAGLSEITLTPKPEYVDALTNWEDPLYRRIVEALPAGSRPAEFITSLDVAAVRP